MTPEQMERAIEFLINHHEKFSTDLEGLKEAVAGLVRSTASLERRAKTERQENRERFARIENQAEADRAEIREAINNLIIANEVTRDLAQKVASLELQTSLLVTDLDHRVNDIESKQP
jgi:hypothetical protein